jgi:hypothetical protein
VFFKVESDEVKDSEFFFRHSDYSVALYFFIRNGS